MKQVCGWCGKHFNSEEYESPSAGPITQGICRSCVESVFSSIDLPLAVLLDSLDGLIMALDSSGHVCLTNTKTEQQHMGKLAEVLRDALCGTVISCPHATEPGGCWQTMFCSQCGLRLTVLETFHTGEARERLPVSFLRNSNGQQVAIDLLITTQSLGELVLLRIDRAREVFAS